jgi:hypothetical protein
MGFARFKRETQGLAGTEEMRLADDVIEGTRAEPIGERCVGLAFLKQIRARR